ncbi:hypothetical protein T484DRAFT_1847924 [Baffinella frigidus]|nr:hypothetical protein T484DRAFT_1847924 [Cryptophyta sp. CCMP2293]
MVAALHASALPASPNADRSDNGDAAKAACAGVLALAGRSAATRQQLVECGAGEGLVAASRAHPHEVSVQLAGMAALAVLCQGGVAARRRVGECGGVQVQNP